MNNEIILNDTVNVSDSKIRGIVILQNPDGTVVFKKENIIVESGREYIRNLLYSKIDDEFTEDRFIKTLKFGSGTTLTKPSDTTLESSFYSVVIATDEDTLLVRDPDEDTLALKLTTTVTSSGITSDVMSELGLFLSDTPETMFSRLVFEPVPFTSTTTYNLTYYIYF
jgi:hypothetical protein